MESFVVVVAHFGGGFGCDVLYVVLWLCCGHDCGSGGCVRFSSIFIWMFFLFGLEWARSARRALASGVLIWFSLLRSSSSRQTPARSMAGWRDHGRDVPCFHAGRPAWGARLIPGGGGFFFAETQNTQAKSQIPGKTQHTTRKFALGPGCVLAAGACQRHGVGGSLLL